jgi:hypothetical protein
MGIHPIRECTKAGAQRKLPERQHGKDVPD